MSFVDKIPPLFDCIAVNYISDVYTYFSLQEAMFDRDEIKDFNDYCNYYLVDYNLKYLEEKVLSFKKDKNVNFVQYLLNSKFLFPIELTDNVKNDIIIYDVSSFIGGDEPLEYEITDKDYAKFAEFFSICSQKFPLYLTLFNKIYDDVIFNSSIDLISEYVAKSEKTPKINYNTLLVLELEEYLYHQIPLIATDLKQNPSSDFSVDSFRILLFQVMSNLSSLVLNETETRSYLEQVKSYFIKNEVNFFLLSSWLSKLTNKKSPIFNYAYNWLVQDTNQRLPYFPKPLADSSTQTIEDAYFALVDRAKELSRGVPFTPMPSAPTIVPLIKAEFTPQEIKFDSLFDENTQKYIMDLLADLAITKDNKAIISPRKKGAIRGVVEALRECHIIPNINLDNLCRIIGVKILLDIKSKIDHSDTSSTYKKKAIQYIKNNPLS